MTDEELDAQPDVQRSRRLQRRWAQQQREILRGEPIDWSALPARDFLAVVLEFEGEVRPAWLQSKLLGGIGVRLMADLERRGLARLGRDRVSVDARGRERHRADVWVVDVERALQLPVGPPEDLVGLVSVDRVVQERQAASEAAREEPPLELEEQARPEPRPVEVGPCGACGETKELRRDGRCRACFWSGFELRVRGAGLELEGARERAPARPRRRNVEAEVSRWDLGEIDNEPDSGPAVDNEAPAEIAPAPQPKRVAMRRELTCDECGEEWTYEKPGRAPAKCPACKAGEGGGEVAAPRSRSAGPKVARKRVATKRATSALADEIAAMQLMAEAVEDLPRELAIKALRWVLDRLEADQVVEDELAEREDEEAA